MLVRPTPPPFDWADPFRLEDQLTEDERMLRDAAAEFAQSQLAPRIIAANRDDAAPLQTFTTSADATYDSLEGVSGNQSAPQRPNSDIGGARVYTSQTASAAVQILPVEAQPKRIRNLSNTPLAGRPDTQGVAIGEEIEYRLNTLLPVALLRNFVIRESSPFSMSVNLMDAATSYRTI